MKSEYKKIVLMEQNENYLFLKRYLKDYNIEFISENNLNEIELSNILFLAESNYFGINKVEEKFTKVIKNKFNYNHDIKNMIPFADNCCLIIWEINGYGGFNEFLKISANQNSEMADALYRWQRAIVTAGKKVSQDFYNKLWLDVYTSLDTNELLPFNFGHSCFKNLNKILNIGEKMDINSKIILLRNEMKKRNIDAYIIPSADPHQSEYVAPRWKAREWISGFSGSAGTVVVTNDEACLWVDSRYYSQAEREIKNSEFILFRWGEPGVNFYNEWLAEKYKDKCIIGFDGALISQKGVNLIKNSFKDVELELKYQEDLIDVVWKERPSIPANKVERFDVKYSGKSRKDKINTIREKLQALNIDMTFISSLDDICWIINLRGSDVMYNPVVISYLLISHEKVVFFVDENKMSEDLIDKLQKDGVTIEPYENTFEYIKKIEKKTVYLDSQKTSKKIYDLFSDNDIREGVNFSTGMKAKKNKIELKGFRDCHIEDAVAMTKWLFWVKKNVGLIEMDEVSVADQLEYLRKQNLNFKGLSFNSIVGYLENGANPHYSAKKESCKKIFKKGILLCDSGGQYNGGTTDITRTFTLGEPEDEEKKHFTLVLKGMIKLTMAVFPKGTTGAQLDTFARMDMWKEGLNFGHGTGHGVGHHLCVHEGPQGISPKSASVPLEAGMIVSNEPGLYFVGKYGIRIENLVAVKEFADNSDFLTFETLTKVPIDLNLIEVNMLDEEEKNWLNDYHRNIYEELSFGLNEEEKNWLEEQTRRI